MSHDNTVLVEAARFWRELGYQIIDGYAEIPPDTMCVVGTAADLDAAEYCSDVLLHLPGTDLQFRMVPNPGAAFEYVTHHGLGFYGPGTQLQLGAGLGFGAA